jgi:Rap1a immunity proteins
MGTMRLIDVALVALYLVVVSPSTCDAQSVDSGARVSLTSGNDLYSWCQTAQDIIISGGDNVKMKEHASTEDLTSSALCWGYVRGVVDSIPVGEKFYPDPEVKLSQYIDVVLAYLKQHPNIRQNPAAVIVRIAVEEAFPGKPKH